MWVQHVSHFCIPTSEWTPGHIFLYEPDPSGWTDKGLKQTDTPQNAMWKCHQYANWHLVVPWHFWNSKILHALTIHILGFSLVLAELDPTQTSEQSPDNINKQESIRWKNPNCPHYNLNMCCRKKMVKMGFFLS